MLAQVFPEVMIVNIKPAAAIRQNYNAVAQLCRDTGESVYLTKNGEGDLVVMDVASSARRESMLGLRERLLAVEEARAAGVADLSLDEACDQARKNVFQAMSHGRA